MKNFIAIIRRYKVAMVMNFVGLVLAFTAFMALMLQVEYQRGFDRDYPTAGRIYRVDKAGADKEDVFRNILPRGYVDDIIGSSPHIEAGSISCPYISETIFYITSEHGRSAVRHGVDVIYPGFFEILGAEFTECSAEALNDLSHIAIPESLAQRLFGKEPATGKILSHDEEYRFGPFRSKELTVGAVYKDFPENSQFGNKIFMNIGSINEGSYGGANYICWLLLDSSDSKERVEKNFNENYDYGDTGGWLTDIELTPVEDIYFSEGESKAYKSGSWTRMWLLTFISFLVMLVAGMNYATFFTALAPMRVKAINTKKVFGSPLNSLRISLIAEAVTFSLLAFVIALCIIGPVTHSLVSYSLIDMSFEGMTGMNVALMSGCAAILIGLVSGIYPSLYVTSLPPAFALKGNFAFSASGRSFRTAMLILQYVISFILLFFSMYVYRQNGYMMNYYSGFDKDSIAVVEISQNHATQRQDWLKDRMTGLPEVEDVAFSMELVGVSDEYSTMTSEFDGKEIRFYTIYCSHNFLDVMGIPVIEGRNFLESDAYYGRSIINSRMRELGAAPGNYPDMGEIIGVTGQVRINSLRNEEAPVCYVLFPKEYGSLSFVYIRLKEGFDKATVLNGINEILDEMDSSYLFDVKFYDELSGMLYDAELRQGRIISLFSLLAAMLSLVGIFGQVLLDVQYRRRDIAVRKVYGAETPGLLAEGLKKYALTVTVAFILAAPAAWVAVNRWLESFVSRIPLSPWPFIGGFLMILALTSAIVTMQYWRAAVSAPADTLKTE